MVKYETFMNHSVDTMKLVKSPFISSLTVKSEPITVFDEELKKLSLSMLRTMVTYNGAGLAGVQVGVLKRIFVMETKNKEYLVICNPKILKAEGRIKWEEGCLSLPGSKVKKLRRAHTYLEFQDIAGELQQIDLHERDSVCALHEIDHLDGILMLDHLNQKLEL